MGTQLPPKRGTAPMAGWIKMPLGIEVGLSPGDFALDGDPALPQNRRHSPQFSAHVYCSQMAGFIRIPLGTQVGLRPGNIVLDGDPTPPPLKGYSPPPIFGPCPLWPNGWIDQDATWYVGRPRPRPHCVRRRPNPPPT